ncbi:MAG TPA: DNA topoisomerase IB, partial [Bryobacteraceae bacterium]|nr:DNA topoisomerase IB [Bryobacteraceae bacterium]
RSLVIPPAWEEVWICPTSTGHLQAVGRDAKGRKQYRYHSLYRHVRDQTKFGRMLAFGAALAKIRARIDGDLALRGLPRNKVLAAVVKLLDTTCMRIGNDEYKKQNDSYGLTTLQDKHVHVEGGTIRFRFRGKSGKEQNIILTDPRLAKVVRKSRDLPGYELFQYVDEDGKVCDITSTDVNGYIREISGEDFTAKDFRTWGGTGLAVLSLEAMGAAETDNTARKNIVAAVKEVAGKLGNRPATCKKYYVHPAVLEAYEDGTLFDILGSCSCTDRGDARRAEECIMKLVARYVEKLAPPKRPDEDLLPELTRSLKRRRA